MGATPKCRFSQDSQVGTLTTLDAYNFLCRPLIEVRSRKHLYTLLKAFQRYVAHPLHAYNLGQFLIFNG